MAEEQAPAPAEQQQPVQPPAELVPPDDPDRQVVEAAHTIVATFRQRNADPALAQRALRVRGLDTATALRAAARLREKTGMARERLRAALQEQERSHAANTRRLDGARNTQEAQHKEILDREGALLAGARGLQQNVFQAREFFGIAAPEQPAAGEGDAKRGAQDAEPEQPEEEGRGLFGGLVRSVAQAADVVRDAALGLVADRVVEETEQAAQAAPATPAPATYRADHEDVVAVNDIASLTVAFKRDEVLAMLGTSVDAVSERLARAHEIARTQIAQSEGALRQEEEAYAQFTAKLTAAYAKVNDQLAQARAAFETQDQALAELDAKAREVQAFFRT